MWTCWPGSIGMLRAADRLAVAEHHLAGGDGRQGDFVAGGNGVDWSRSSRPSITQSRFRRKSGRARWRRYRKDASWMAEFSAVGSLVISRSMIPIFRARVRARGRRCGRAVCRPPG